MGDTNNPSQVIEYVFRDIYAPSNQNRNLIKKMTNYTSSDQHPFLTKFYEYIKNPKQLDGELSKCDDVFCEYLYRISRLAKPDFFCKILKFVTLFRECLNIQYSDKVKTEGYLYSEEFNAEDAPDISNDLVTDFLDTESLVFDFGKEDAIEMTQNFCQWMYDNNFTCSKLSLISNI